MDFKHSRRILAVGAPNSGVLDVIEDLTGSAPLTNENGSTAGLTHEWHIKTTYYTAKVPIWVDEIADTDAWKTEFMKPEAKEVIEAVGAWILCFRRTQDAYITKDVEDTMKAIQEISEEHASYETEAVMLAVSIPHAKSVSRVLEAERQADWDDLCLHYGFEHIDYAATETNEYGEKAGFERVKEALEANEWAANTADDGRLDIESLDFDAEDDLQYSFARDEAEMTAELFGMKAALTGEDFEPDADDVVPRHRQASEVDNLDRLMGKLLAVKEQSADLPEVQRKRMAAKAVRELMSEDASSS